MVSVMLYPCILCVFSVIGFVLSCLLHVFTCFVICLVKQLAISLGVVCYFVVECYGSV